MYNYKSVVYLVKKNKSYERIENQPNLVHSVFDILELHVELKEITHNARTNSPTQSVVKSAGATGHYPSNGGMLLGLLYSSV